MLEDDGPIAGADGDAGDVVGRQGKKAVAGNLFERRACRRSAGERKPGDHRDHHEGRGEADEFGDLASYRRRRHTITPSRTTESGKSISSTTKVVCICADRKSTRL